jgi:integrase
MPLTALSVKAAKSKAGPYKLSDEKGLYLLVTTKGSKLWRFDYHKRQTTHGLRRCASTILNETGQFEPDWIETQLAHTDHNKVRGAYNAAIYLKHRASMLQWWADFVDRQTNVCRIAA